MAERDDAQERSFEPTPKRRAEARTKGQIPRSRELSTMAMMLTAAAAMVLTGAHAVRALEAGMHAALAPDRLLLEDARALAAFFSARLVEALGGIAPFLAVMAVMAMLAPLAIGGWNFSAEALAFKAERLDPVKGLKRVFGPRGLVELAKALAKFVLLLGVAVLVLWLELDRMLALARAPVEPALIEGLLLLGRTAAIIAAATVVIALVDVPFQIWDHHRNLRMSREELKEENKQTEGRPEVRSRIRALQQEVARRRMMEQVPGADVIVTNPTHFAVALRYDPVRMGAPVVVARGADLIARRIRELGEQHGVPVLSAPLLARALYFSTQVDQPIPVGLYRAVAQVLAWVFQLRATGPGQRPPAPPTDLPVPPELRREP